MNLGVNSQEKPKVKGRGRGMARNFSNEDKEPGTTNPERSEDNKNDEKVEVSPSPREVKVRRTKAGFEPYQVKKKLSVVQVDQKKSPEKTTRRSSGGRRRNTDEGKDTDNTQKKSRNRSKSGTAKDQTNIKKNKNSTSRKSAPDEVNQQDTLEVNNSIPETKSQVEEKHEKIKNEEKQKQKALGHTLLECPCSLSPAENCSDYAPSEKTVNSTGEQLTVEKDALDKKFLVASPVMAHKDNSVLDSECDNSDAEHNVLQLSPSTPMSNDEINALFTSPEQSKENTQHSSIPPPTNRNKQRSFEADSSTIIISSGNSDLQSRKESLEETFECESTSLDSKKKPKEANKLYSIKTILNENKNLNDNLKQLSTSDFSRGDNKKSKEKNKKRSDRRNKREKDNDLKSEIGRKSTGNNSKTKDNERTDSNKQGGLISLPEAGYVQKHTDDRDESYNRYITPTQTGSDEHDKKSILKVERDSAMKRHLKVIETIQTKMKKMFTKPFDDSSSIEEIMKNSDDIQQQYGELIVSYQEYAFKHDFENAMWKSAFHNIITKFREFIETNNSSKELVQSIGSLYWKFLQNGIQYLDALTTQLQEYYDFDLDTYLKDPVQMQRCNRQVKFSLRSCHLFLIFIGDLERYISLLQQGNDYSQAQKCYKQAQMLAPKNGKSYNQLAVVAVLTKRKLDAVYYYARSLQASNPFMTAKDRLTTIFHEIKKKAQVLQQTDQLIGHQKNNNYYNRDGIRNEREAVERTNRDHLRDEIWIFFRQGHMFKVMLTDANEVVLLTSPPSAVKITSEVQSKTSSKQLRDDKLSIRKINRGFIIYFLFIHCKLYTNIGLEEFTLIHEETLSSFATLLEHPRLSTVREENLLKYVAINLFSIHHLIEKNGSSIEVVPNTALDLAIIFALDMFSLLCKHCVKLLREKGVESVDPVLPSIRVWLLWMRDNIDLVTNSSVRGMLDIWSEICVFLNEINAILYDQQVGRDTVGEMNVYLNEDIFLAGFKPYSSQLKHGPADSHSEALMCRTMRIKSIKETIDALDENGKLPFAYDEKDHMFKAVPSDQVFTSPVKKVKEFVPDETDEEEEDSDEVIIEDDDDDEAEGYGEFNMLKAHKAELTRQIEENERRRQEALAVIETQKAAGRHLSENSPNYLITDTNCFINHLPFVEQLLNSTDFHVVVPLIVINELDGLKKPSESFHQQNVQVAARMAIDFLEDRFSQHDPNIRAITSNGSEMTTIVFRAEELSSDKGTNDDVILSCCLRYCKEDIRKEGESNIVRRNVVLLTDDRNLRLKAHSRVVPTVSIATFMKMAQFK